MVSETPWTCGTYVLQRWLCSSARLQIMALLYKLCAALNNFFHSLAHLVFLICSTSIKLLPIPHRNVISMREYAYPQRRKLQEGGETVLHSRIAGHFSSYPVATVVKQMKSPLWCWLQVEEKHIHTNRSFWMYVVYKQESKYSDLH